MVKEGTLTEIVFVAEEALEGGYTARALGASIFTEADTLEALEASIRDAVRCHFDESERPRFVRLHIVHDQLIAEGGSRGTSPGVISPGPLAPLGTTSSGRPAATSD